MRIGRRIGSGCYAIYTNRQKHSNLGQSVDGKPRPIARCLRGLSLYQCSRGYTMKRRSIIKEVRQWAETALRFFLEYPPNEKGLLKITGNGGYENDFYC